MLVMMATIAEHGAQGIVLSVDFQEYEPLLLQRELIIGMLCQVLECAFAMGAVGSQVVALGVVHQGQGQCHVQSGQR